jgi:hypothetical protein
MTISPHPSFLLCCRCSTCALADEAQGWHALLVPDGTYSAGPMRSDGTAEAIASTTTLDICPHCAAVLLRVLRQTPDILEDASWV